MPDIVPKRILLVDDHALFRESLAMLLQLRLGYNVVKCSDCLESVRQDVEDLKPDVVLMDYHLPTGDALAVGQDLKQRYSEIKLMYLTGTQSGAILNQLVSSRADGIIHKEIDHQELADSIVNVLNGQRVISPKIREKLPMLLSQFTDREFQLFRLLVKGANNKQIAEQLNISPRTVEKHRENLFKKAGVQNAAQLIELGYKWQILDIEAGA